MKIDLVGTIWVLSFFLYGWKAALAVASIMAIYIAIFSSTTPLVGAVMKFIATTPMFLVPALMIKLPFFHKKESNVYGSVIVITIAAILASLARLYLTTVVNLYWAVPIYMGMTPDQILAYFGGIIPFVAFVAGMNVVQGIVDIYVPWILAFKLGLSRHFGTW